MHTVAAIFTCLHETVFMSHFRMALALALTVALGPFAIDAYLPAFPAMAASLGASVHDIALSISVYIMALAVGQLVGGPLADRYGRQPVMFAGLLIFSLASAGLAQADTLSGLLLLRAAQAFGGGWTTACVPAIVRDQVQGTEAAKLFSLIALIMIGAPAVAPSLGALLLTYFDWHSIFVFLAVYGATLILVVKLLLFSGGGASAYVADTTPALHRYLAVFSKRPALRFIFIQAATFSVMMLFVTHSSYIYQGHYHVSNTLFGILFGANIVVMALMNIVNRKLLNIYPPQTILRHCLLIQMAAAMFLVAVAYWQLPLWCFVMGTVITIGMFGGISPNNQACYMDYFHKNGGTAGALMGAIQFSIAGGLSALSALLPEALLTVVLTQALCSVIGVILAWTPKIFLSRGGP